MPQADDLSRSLAQLDQDVTLIAVVEMSQSSWLVGGLVPSVDRRPLKKVEADTVSLHRLLERWRAQGMAGGRRIERVVLACEAGRDGFWLGTVAAGPGPARPHRTGVALSAVPEGQCTGTMVPRANERRRRRTQNEDDRGARSQTAHRLMAAGQDRRDTGGRDVATGGLRNAAAERYRDFGSRASRPAAIDDPGWRSAEYSHGFDAEMRTVPPIGALPLKRMTAQSSRRLYRMQGRSEMSQRDIACSWRAPLGSFEGCPALPANRRPWVRRRA